MRPLFGQILIFMLCVYIGGTAIYRIDKRGENAVFISRRAMEVIDSRGVLDG